MKNLFRILLVSLFFASLFSCSKNKAEASKQLVTKPEAISLNDSKSGGIYKGVIIGSTGIVKIVLQDGKLVAEVTVDGVTKVLTTNDLAQWASGEAITGCKFEKDDWKLTFSVNADGTEASVSAVIPGHTSITVVAIKELSDQLVTAYEGTYKTTGIDGEGTWNFLTYGEGVIGIYRLHENEDVLPFYGSVINNQLNAESFAVVIHGTTTSTEASGTWEGNSGAGTWKGKRTL